MGLLTACVVFVIAIAMQHDLGHMQTSEGNRQLQGFSNTIRLYVENHLAVLKDQASLPFATQAVMQPEANQARISDFLESLTLLGAKPQIGFLDYEGRLVHATREHPALEFLPRGELQALLKRSMAEYAVIQQDGDALWWCFAVPILYEGAVEGFLAVAIPLEQMALQAGLHQQGDGLLELYRDDLLLTVYGNSHLTGAGQETFLKPFGLRLVYKNEFSDVVVARNQFILYVLGVILIFALALVGLASIWGRKIIVSPLENIRLATSRIANGGKMDFSNLERSQIREIQHLVQDFKHMAIQLEERDAGLRVARDSLEAKVQEQTQSLLESHQRYRRVLEGTRAGLWDWNIQTGETIFNERWAEICGYTLEELEPVSIKTWMDLVHPEDVQKSGILLDRHFSGELPYYKCECRMKHKAGHWVWVHDRGKVVSWNAENKPLQMAGTHMDITIRKAAEENERQARENFETLFNTVEDFLFVLDEQGRILHANATVIRRLGYALEELKGLPVSMAHPEERRAEAEEVVRAMLSGATDSCPVPLISRTGSLIPVETRITHGQWDGKPVLFGVCKDVSTLQRSEEALRSKTALLEAQTNSTLDGILVIDSDNRRIFANQRVMELFDVPEPLRVQTDDDTPLMRYVVGLAKHPEQFLEKVSFLYDHPNETSQEEIEFKSGMVLDRYSAPVIGAEGKYYGRIWIFRDITQRKQAEAVFLHQTQLQKLLMDISATYINLPLEAVDQALQASLRDMGEFVEADRSYIFDYDFDAGICSNTFEWCQTGIPPQIDELKAVPISELSEWVGIHQQGDAIYYPDVSALPPGGVRDILEPQEIKSLLTIPLMNQSECLGFVGFDSVGHRHAYSEKERALLSLFAQMLTNIRLRRQSEAELVEATARANAMAQKANEAARAKSMFLANVSHEIRTPLNAILGYAQILHRTCAGCDRESARKGLDVIMSSGTHLMELINDVLELTRSENAPAELNECDFDFHAVLGEVHRMFQQQSGKEHLSIELEALAGVPRFLCSDSRKVRQILINLVGNAVKFTSVGWIRISAAVSASEGDHIEISVCIADSGTGIPANQLDQIFSVFEQAEEGEKSGTGTGLGLPISRQHAQSLGGDVTVSSEEGCGSEFHFMFKAKPGGSVPLAAERKVLALAPNQPVRRLLLVEDDETNLAMLTTMLGTLGFETQTARNGLQALNILTQDAAFDAVLLDMKMPGMDGAETLHRLRGLPGMETLPVLVLTASALPGEAARLRRQGADGFVPKPLKEALILEEIRRLVGVQYTYEETTEDLRMQSTGELKLQITSELPVAVVDALRSELKRGHVHGLRAIIGEQAAAHPELTSQLKMLIENYEYERLEQILDQRRPG